MSKVIQIGLLCEGPTDIIIVKAIAGYLTSLGYADYKFDVIVPMVDETSGLPLGGWQRIQRWCKSHSGGGDIPVSGTTIPGINLNKINEYKVQQGWRGIVATSEVSLLLVMMDGDIAEKIDDLSCLFSFSGLGRSEYCEKAIRHWLQVDSGECGCAVVVPTYAIESWIIAAHDHTNVPKPLARRAMVDYESLSNWKHILRSLGWRHKNGKLEKDTSHYNSFAVPRLLNYFCSAMERCEQMMHLDNVLFNAGLDV